jgi:hypothetical protein
MAKTHEIVTDPSCQWINWFHAFVHRELLDEFIEPRLFFGESCALIRAGLEAIHSRGLEPPKLLKQDIEEMLSNQLSEVSKVYGGMDHHQQEGKVLWRGLGRTIKAACTGRPIDYSLLADAARDFDQVWPIAGAVLPPPILTEEDNDFCAYHERTGGRQGAGFWIVWDLFARLRGTAPPSDPRASIPILLFGEAGKGKVAELTVELIDRGSGFRPDPFFLGLTALNEGKDGLTALDEGKGGAGFHQAMQRAWQRAGMDDRGCRGRWWVRGFQRPHTDSRDPFAVAILSGRSAEAAACCALWAALGYIPGDADGKHVANHELDPLATISAQIAKGSESGRAIRLEPVSGVPEKLKAALDKKLSKVLVAQLQKEGNSADQATTSLGGPILVATLGEAFDELLLDRRAMSNSQQHVNRLWNNEWAEGTGDADGHP